MDTKNSRRTNRWRWLVVLAPVIAVVAAYLPMWSALGPDAAEATHGERTLDATPENGSAQIGTPITVTATVDEDATQPIEIDFEVEGGPADDEGDGNAPESADASCFISTGTNSCSTQFVGDTGGTSRVRVWIDHDQTDESEGGVTEADRAEGPTDPCAIDDVECQALGDPAGEPGAVEEPDSTDVIVLTWGSGLQLDCNDSNPNNGAEVETNRLDETENYVCTVTNFSGQPIANANVDMENLDGANDPDDSAAAGEADFTEERALLPVEEDVIFCTTDASGRCTAQVAAGEQQTGSALLCFWVETNANENTAYDPAGAADDGGECDTEELDDTEGDNGTDIVQLSWGAPVVSGLDAESEISNVDVGRSTTITGIVYDQFGTAIASTTTVNFELFEGSVGGFGDDQSPTASCSTNGSSTCSVSLTSDDIGSAVVCVWFGNDPTLTGTVASNPRCDNEGPTDSTGDRGAPSPPDDRVDVVRRTFQADDDNGGGGGGGGTTTTTAPSQGPSGEGYWQVAADGTVYAFGSASNLGSQTALNQPIVGMAEHPSGNGYWLVARDGGIFSFGTARFHGSTGGIALNQPIVGMTATPSGNGYWFVASDGGIFAFGDAKFFGSKGGQPLNRPVVGMASTPTGQGYWLVASDGGVFSFGDARFFGSTGDIRLNQPVVGMDRTASGSGYWFVAADGGIFAYGDARFFGSTGNIALQRPITGMAATRAGNGYWFTASDGGLFSYGDAQFKGAAASRIVRSSVVGVAGM